jgi:hypothetical protein
VVREAVFVIYNPMGLGGTEQTDKVSQRLRWDQGSGMQTPVFQINRISTSMMQRAMRVDPTDETLRPRIYTRSGAKPEHPNVKPMVYEQFQYGVYVECECG